MSCGEKRVEGRVGHEAGDGGCGEMRAKRNKTSAQLESMVPATSMPGPKDIPGPCFMG